MMARPVGEEPAAAGPPSPRLFRERAAWEEFRAARTAGGAPETPAPAVDFDREILLVLTAGPTGLSWRLAESDAGEGHLSLYLEKEAGDVAAGSLRLHVLPRRAGVTFHYPDRGEP